MKAAYDLGVFRWLIYRARKSNSALARDVPRMRRWVRRRALMAPPLRRTGGHRKASGQVAWLLRVEAGQHGG